ncbi:hypothetical protein BFW01_g1006 [Lasiodiplodia theobromae]|uniref:Peptidase S8/S53 domain-containing protein n=1 Tax=Lasiodiplodia theobromae TaxID=45133 RepID=A0A8H7MBQ2_9PEZI|nr:hypothetical protein BFW01_g1006 [Lasiodiplodia theobromae]
MQEADHSHHSSRTRLEQETHHDFSVDAALPADSSGDEGEAATINARATRSERRREPDEYEYFQPGFDPSSITVPRLRSILLAHNIKYRPLDKKLELIALFNQYVAPQAQTHLAAQSGIKRENHEEKLQSSPPLHPTMELRRRDPDEFQPDFDPCSISVPRLRSILFSHNVKYPSSAKKSELVALFNKYVAPQAQTYLAAQLRSKRLSREDGVAASDTPDYSACLDLNLDLMSISDLEIGATHGSTTEPTGQPRSLDLQTEDFQPSSAPPQRNSPDEEPKRATWKKAESSTAQLTRLNSEPGTMIQTGINAWTNGEVTMFDHIDCIDESKKKATDKWFSMFKDLVLPMFPEKRQQRPVKIAVLNAGIDLNNPAISLDRGKIKDKMSFVPNEDWTDHVGHGTQVTSLLLRMAYNAHIYVARVAQGSKLDDPAYIAEALRYATESWEVDIINMSFGFDSDNRVIGAAIKNAYAANVLMFAAARNDGGNFGVAFPAKHKDVICISATDGYGTSSSFNPPVFDTSDNFATIGESLEFRSFRGGHVSMSSGTSYATPVAVSIASLVLEYVRERFPDGEKGEAEKRLRESPDGMRAALNLMSYRIKDHRYIAPWKLFNAKGENNSYIHLRSALKNPDI